MENRKQINKKTFATKKFHSKMEKIQRVATNQNLSLFCNYDFEALRNFMENKYDYLLEKDLQTQININKAVINQIKLLKNNLIAESKKQFVAFMRKECESIAYMSDENIIKLADDRKCKGNFYHISHNNPKEGLIINVRTNITYEKPEQKFFFWNFSGECLRDIDVKRMKKDCIELLDVLIIADKKRLSLV